MRTIRCFDTQGLTSLQDSIRFHESDQRECGGNRRKSLGLLRWEQPGPGTLGKELLGEGLTFGLGLLDAANGTEALLKLVDPALGIDELLLTREEGMRIGGDTDRNHEVVDPVNILNPVRLGGRLSDVLLPGAHVLEDDRVIFGVEILFHGNMPFRAGGEVA